MPNQKLSYKVDVDTGEAVRDLARLGTAGADAGKDIADGFGKAESASKKALDALSAKLDETERDAKGLAEAVAAIKAHLTVDVDDAKVAGFASDLKNKMGVAFDDVTADAKAFADVLERGIDMSKTTGEIRNVGDQLDHTRSEADQSRSVLANMAGNAAQDLGELGGVVGTLGVGIGQLAEYATEGNVSLRGLAGVAGPMAALAGASLLIQGISSGLADLKKRQEAYTQQQEDFNTALRESGDLQATVNDMLENNVELSAAPELNWWQGMMDDLPVLTGMVDETTTAQSGLVEALAASGTSAEAFTFALDHGLGPFNAMMQSWADARDQGRITQEQYDLLTTQLDLYSQTALRAEVQQQNLNTVFGDGTTAVGAYQKEMGKVEGVSGNVVKATAGVIRSTEDAAAAAQAYAAALADSRQATEEAAAAMSSTDWSTAAVDAATAALSQGWTDHTKWIDDIAAVQQSYDDLAEAFHAQGDNLFPDFSTPEGRAVLEGLEAVGQTLIPDIAKAFSDSHGDIATFQRDVGGLYNETLRGLSDQLGISQSDVMTLLNAIGLTPAYFNSQYELLGTEEAKLKLDLLQTAIGLLPENIQLGIAAKISQGDFTGAAALAQAWLAPGVTVKVNPNVDPFKKGLAGLQVHASNHPIVQPVVVGRVTTVGVSGGYSKSTQTAGVGVDAFAAPAESAASSGSTLVLTAPQAPGPVTINLHAGVVGNRYELERWLRAATRDQQRLGRLP